MKQLVFALLFMAGGLLTASAQTSDKERVHDDLNDLRDRMELKELVDKFSILADQKDVPAQVQLFTEDGVVEFYNGNERQGEVNGRKQIGDAFAPYLALFDTVYHINGQQIVNIEGNRATGISYCQVVLIGSSDGKRTMTTEGVYYNDEFVRHEGKWLIAKRASHFMWRDVKEIPYQKTN